MMLLLFLGCWIRQIRRECLELGYNDRSGPVKSVASRSLFTLIVH